MEPQLFIHESEVIDGLNVKYMNILGVWNMVNDYKSKGVKNATLKIGCIITLVLFVPFVAFNALSFMYVTVTIERATLLILNPLTAVQSIVKAGVFWYGLEKQCKLITVLKKTFLTSIPNEKRDQMSKIYKDKASTSNYFCIAALIANCTTVFFWNFLPIARSKFFEEYFHIKLYTKDKGVNKILGGWYPFPYTESPWSEIVYVYEFVVCAWAGVTITLYELLLVQLVLMLCAHINVLDAQISSLKVDNTEKKSEIVRYDVDEDQELYSQLILCVKDHQRILQMGNEFKDFFNVLITMQMGIGILILIISVFHFVYGAKDWLFTLKFLIYLGYQFVEIVLYCFSGNFLESASTGLSFSVYNSDWYKQKTKFQKTGQMIMVRSLKPVSLIAIRLYPVNLMTLTNIMQLTYSSSTLMSNLTI